MSCLGDIYRRNGLIDGQGLLLRTPSGKPKKKEKKVKKKLRMKTTKHDYLANFQQRGFLPNSFFKMILMLRSLEDNHIFSKKEMSSFSSVVNEINHFYYRSLCLSVRTTFSQKLLIATA